MDRRTRKLFALVFAAIVAVTGGAALILSEPSTPNPDAPSGTTPAVGVIVAVDSHGLADVRGFTLRDEDGQLRDFDLRAYETSSEFPPGHLVEHQATATPVRVWYRPDGGTLLAIRLEDAPR